ncbi:MAG TPA: DUF3857 domain-containing protein [Terriglobia bacterium]|nr:DUF3857 domain-containing protein [Terriglobia bacterium]
MRRHAHFSVACATLFGAIGLVPHAFAQVAQTGGDGWPAINPAELALKDNPASPGSAAMILYREVQKDDVARVETEYCRIKIFTEEGRKRADIEIPWVPKANEITDIRARTVSPDGSALEFNGEIFDKTVLKARKVKVQVKAFTLPGVQTGSVIEYSYTVHWREKWPDYLIHPGNYIIDVNFVMPTEVWDVDQDIFAKKEHFALRSLPNARLGWTGLSMRTGATPISHGENTQLDVENIPALQEEDFMPPESTLKGQVALYYMVGTLYSIDAFWSQLGRHWAEGLQGYMGKPKVMEREVGTLISPNDSDDAKLRKLYERVQRVRALSYEEDDETTQFKENKTVADVLKHDYAGAHEINLLFVALARAAGFEADPVEVTQRATGYFRKQLPYRDQFDAMVVWVNDGKSGYYLDPATLDCPFGLLPWNESDAGGLRVGAQAVLIKTPAPKSSDAVIERNASLALDSDGSLAGKITINYMGQEALERRIANHKKDETGRRRALEDEGRGWLPAGSSLELKSATHWDEANTPLTAEFAVKIPGAATKTGRRMLVPLEVYEIGAKPLFASATRVNDVDFDYPYQVTDDVTVQLPAGYTVEGLPKPQTLGGSSGVYSLWATQEGTSVHLKRHLAVEQYYVPVSDYAQLRSFFSSVRTSDEEEVVLQAQTKAQGE